MNDTTVTDLLASSEHIFYVSAPQTQETPYILIQKEDGTAHNTMTGSNLDEDFIEIGVIADRTYSKGAVVGAYNLLSVCRMSLEAAVAGVYDGENIASINANSTGTFLNHDMVNKPEVEGRQSFQIFKRR